VTTRIGLKHTCAWKDEDWKVTFAYRPVHLNALSNEVQSFPPPSARTEQTVAVLQCLAVIARSAATKQSRPGYAPPSKIASLRSQ